MHLYPVLYEVSVVKSAPLASCHVHVSLAGQLVTETQKRERHLHTASHASQISTCRMGRGSLEDSTAGSMGLIFSLQNDFHFVDSTNLTSMDRENYCIKAQSKKQVGSWGALKTSGHSSSFTAI